MAMTENNFGGIDLLATVRELDKRVTALEAHPVQNPVITAEIEKSLDALAQRGATPDPPNIPSPPEETGTVVEPAKEPVEGDQATKPGE